MSASLPLDIKTPWLNVARRLQSVARSGGLAVITIKIVVNADGIPVSWTSPRVTQIEPRASEALLDLLTTEDE